MLSAARELRSRLVAAVATALLALALVAANVGRADCAPTTGSRAGSGGGGKQCGSQTCDLLEFCSPVHEQCVPCDSICRVTHNYDPHMCASQCEHYLLEQRNADLSGAIHRLQSQQTITFALLLVLAILFVAINGVQAIRWLRRHDHLSFRWLKRMRSGPAGGGGKSATALPADQMMHANPHTQSPKLTQRASSATANLTLGVLEKGSGPALRAMQRQQSTAGVSEDGLDTLSNVHTVSTPISRHPAEDSTESFSYDNAGLQVTPTTNKPPKSETTF